MADAIVRYTGLMPQPAATRRVAARCRNDIKVARSELALGQLQVELFEARVEDDAR